MAKTTEKKTKTAKRKRVSINALEKVMKSTYTPEEVITWHDIEVTITKTLPLKDVIGMVNDVVESCFALEDGDFLPEIRDFAIKSAVLEKYANFTMPSNTSAQYDLVYRTDAFAAVCAHINIEQFNEICLAVDRKLQYKTDSNVEAINRQMQTLFDSFEDIEKNLSSLFEGMNNESMAKLVDAIANGQLDEEKLMKSYFDEKEAHEVKPEQPELKLVETSKD